jgi:hypothetical protein
MKPQLLLTTNVTALLVEPTATAPKACVVGLMAKQELAEPPEEEPLVSPEKELVVCAAAVLLNEEVEEPPRVELEPGEPPLHPATKAAVTTARLRRNG